MTVMISIVIMMMKLVTTINRLLIWVSLRMCESDERALPIDKSTPDSLEGQSLHRILGHRHTDTKTQTQTQTRVLQIPQKVRVSNKNRDGHFCSARYKMISQFTWPNFHGGNAEEGTRSLWLYS